MINVQCEIDCYEVDGKETTSMNGARPVLSVSSDSMLHKDRVVLAFPEGKVVTVLARDLQAAVENATNRGAGAS